MSKLSNHVNQHQRIPNQDKDAGLKPTCYVRTLETIRIRQSCDKIRQTIDGPLNQRSFNSWLFSRIRFQIRSKWIRTVDDFGND